MMVFARIAIRIDSEDAIRVLAMRDLDVVAVEAVVGGEIGVTGIAVVYQSL